MVTFGEYFSTLHRLKTWSFRGAMVKQAFKIFWLKRTSDFSASTL
jgi:hypothetical protein